MQTAEFGRHVNKKQCLSRSLALSAAETKCLPLALGVKVRIV